MWKGRQKQPVSNLIFFLFTLRASPSLCLTGTQQLWLKASRREFEMPTQRPEWRPASKTHTHIHTDISENEIMLKTSIVKYLIILLFLPWFFSLAPFIITFLLCIHPSPPSDFSSSLCLLSFNPLFLLSCYLFQGLLGSEEPLSRGGRCFVQLPWVIVPEDPSVLPEELWQRGLTSPEWPLLVLLSGEPQVINHYSSLFRSGFALRLPTLEDE